MTTDDGASDSQFGGPPPVLLAALGAALLIAVGLIFAFASLGGDEGGVAGSETPAGVTTATTPDDRVLLTVSVSGSGIGGVEISPSDVSCNASCEYKFTEGTRVTATAEPLTGSTFEGWGDACTGDGRCSFVMDRTRSLSAEFTERSAAADPLCEEVAPEDRDPTCPPEEEPGTTTQPVDPGPDCGDGRDNDDDGLTDTEQDPDCETSGSEAGTAIPPATTPPPSGTSPSPSPPVANQCTDGEDNDDDGLTDRAQDPDCETGRSESG